MHRTGNEWCVHGRRGDTQPGNANAHTCKANRVCHIDMWCLPVQEGIRVLRVCYMPLDYGRLSLHKMYKIVNTPGL